MIAKFVLEQGDSSGKVFLLEDGERWVFGRDPDKSDIFVDDESVSRVHFVCTYKGPEGYYIENMSKTNPLQVNDTDLEESSLLKDGDRVKIGHAIYRFTSVSEDIVVQGLDDLDREAYFPDEDSIEEDVLALQEQSEEDDQDTIFCDQDDTHDISLAEINFDLLEAGRWLFKIINGPNSGAEFAMETGAEYIVGKDSSECDIIIHDLSVSHKHLKLSISAEEVLEIQDLGSSNGTFVNEEKLEANVAHPLVLTDVITMGTTSFVVIDKEGEAQTIVAPALPALQKYIEQAVEKEEGAKKESEDSSEDLKDGEDIELDGISEEPLPKTYIMGISNKMLILISCAVIFLISWGAISLFQGEEVVVDHLDHHKELRIALKNYPDVQYTFNKSNGKLFLLGHVLTSIDKGQLMYNLQNLTFIDQSSDNIIIDELVWNEMNQTLQWNVDFKGISMYSPRPGLFVLSGVLDSREKAEDLNEYIGINFPYLDRLENHVVVEEEVLAQINRELLDGGFNNIDVAFTDSDIVLKGLIDVDQGFDFKRIVREVEKIRGIRSVRNFVTEQENEEASILDISDRYVVTGNSKVDNTNLSVVINGKILTRGDSLDGMVITSIRPDVVFLEMGGFKYKIEYND